MTDCMHTDCMYVLLIVIGARNDLEWSCKAVQNSWKDSKKGPFSLKVCNILVRSLRDLCKICAHARLFFLSL